MSRIKSMGLMACAAMLLNACAAYPPEEDPVLIKLNELDRRLTAIERVIQNESLVDLMSRVEDQNTELSALRGQVEELAFTSENTAERQRELYLDLDQRLQRLEQGGAAASSAGGGSGSLPVPNGSARDNYQAAFELLKEGRYEQAANAFSQFLETYPDSNLADNAQYWLAESYYVTQQYRKALPAFEKVVTQYPDSRKVPDALLKIGYCNYELGEWNDARAALSRVSSDYADTTAARLAQQRLERMQSEGR